LLTSTKCRDFAVSLYSLSSVCVRTADIVIFIHWNLIKTNTVLKSTNRNML